MILEFWHRNHNCILLLMLEKLITKHMTSVEICASFCITQFIYALSLMLSFHNFVWGLFSLKKKSWIRSMKYKYRLNEVKSLPELSLVIHYCYWRTVCWICRIIWDTQVKDRFISAANRVSSDWLEEIHTGKQLRVGVG